MKLTLFMAQSVNGIIARKNNSEDFLSDYGWTYLLKLVKESGNFIIGRKTYDIVKAMYEDYNFDDIEARDKVIITRDKSFNPGTDYKVVYSPEEAVEYLKNKGYKQAILTGGSQINSEFAKKNLIDEVIINVEPVIITQGIPIVAENDHDLKMKLESYEIFNLNGLTLTYSVIK